MESQEFSNTATLPNVNSMDLRKVNQYGTDYNKPLREHFLDDKEDFEELMK